MLPCEDLDGYRLAFRSSSFEPIRAAPRVALRAVSDAPTELVHRCLRELELGSSNARLLPATDLDTCHRQWFKFKFCAGLSVALASPARYVHPTMSSIVIFWLIIYYNKALRDQLCTMTTQPLVLRNLVVSHCRDKLLLELPELDSLVVLRDGTILVLAPNPSSSADASTTTFPYIQRQSAAIFNATDATLKECSIDTIAYGTMVSKTSSLDVRKSFPLGRFGLRRAGTPMPPGFPVAPDTRLDTLSISSDPDTCDQQWITAYFWDAMYLLTGIICGPSSCDSDEGVAHLHAALAERLASANTSATDGSTASVVMAAPSSPVSHPHSHPHSILDLPFFALPAMPTSRGGARSLPSRAKPSRDIENEAPASGAKKRRSTGKEREAVKVQRTDRTPFDDVLESSNKTVEYVAEAKRQLLESQEWAHAMLGWAEERFQELLERAEAAEAQVDEEKRRVEKLEKDVEMAIDAGADEGLEKNEQLWQLGQELQLARTAADQAKEDADEALRMACVRETAASALADGSARTPRKRKLSL